MNQRTYTYTARDPEKPMQVATFTLQGDLLHIGCGEPLRSLRSPANTVQPPKAGSPQQRMLRSMKSSFLSWLLQSRGPYALSDVDLQFSGNRLAVRAWPRLRGLRTLPLVLTWSEVDNPEAMQAFALELRRRQHDAADMRRFPGVLDYWGAWVLLAFGIWVLGKTHHLRNGRRADPGR